MTADLKKTWLVLLLVSAGVQEARAQDRRIQRVGEGEIRKWALVVGNDAYRRSPLVNAVNDAEAMELSLRDMGFSVESVTDADYPTFDRAVDLFIDRLGRGDVGLFYYAGHGVQVDGENYLIPVDFDRARVAKVKYRALPADLIRERMEHSGARLSILILDACRDNPFHGNRSAGPGLAQMMTGIGTFIAFSTAPGQTATDNPAGGHGLFTQHLIETLKSPGLSIDEVFNEVRRKVYEASGGRQIPWTASSLIGSFFFRPAEPIRIAVDRRRPEIEPQPARTAPAPIPIPTTATFQAGDFCANLEQVLMSCPRGFRDIVVPSRSRTRTFLEPTVCLPGAWYNRVYRAAPDSFEYLSSFETDLGGGPGGRLEDFVARVEACLPADTIAWHQRRSDRHQLEVALAPGSCRLDVAANGENVDLEIYQGR